MPKFQISTPTEKPRGSMSSICSIAMTMVRISLSRALSSRVTHLRHTCNARGTPRSHQRWSTHSSSVDAHKCFQESDTNDQCLRGFDTLQQPSFFADSFKVSGLQCSKMSMLIRVVNTSRNLAKTAQTATDLVCTGLRRWVQHSAILKTYLDSSPQNVELHHFGVKLSQFSVGNTRARFTVWRTSVLEPLACPTTKKIAESNVTTTVATQ